ATHLVEPLAARRLSLRAATSFELHVFRPLIAEGTLAWTCSGTSAREAPGCDHHDANGRIGAAFRQHDYAAYASAGQYARLPTLGEFHGVSLLVRGNPDLVPEYGPTFEMGARYQHMSASRRRVAWIDAATFARYADDLVTYVRTAQRYLLPVNSAR